MNSNYTLHVKMKLINTFASATWLSLNCLHTQKKSLQRAQHQDHFNPFPLAFTYNVLTTFGAQGHNFLDGINDFNEVSMASTINKKGFCNIINELSSLNNFSLPSFGFSSNDFQIFVKH